MMHLTPEQLVIAAVIIPLVVALLLPLLPESVFDQTMARSLHPFVVATQVPNVPHDLPYGVALLLITIVLIMNALSIGFRVRLRNKKKW